MAKKPSDPAVHVRMYRVGLGDCFLVTLDGSAPFHMLIDCGMWEGSATAKARMKQCVADIAKVTGGRLDMLVVTHEHWDHVSGFSAGQGREFFDQATIGRLLVAWTENPNDADARAIRESTAALRVSLKQALRAAEQTGLRGLADEQVLRINGIGKDLGMGAMLGASPTDSFDWIKRRCTDSPTTEVIYASPGRSVAIPGARIHVLGPPLRLEALRKNDGGATGRKSGESYLNADSPDALAEALDSGLTEALMFAASGRTQRLPAYKGRWPFTNGWGADLAAARRREPFLSAIHARHREEAWRSIDRDWASSVSSVALRLDRFTNNTSLALAIELESSGRVLLFPADAQFGNWSSWDEVAFPEHPGLTASELLRRTVLYKVGHHGSHNATLRKRGIDLMTSPDLVAMIPVDETFARSQPPNGWNMPYPALLQDLRTRTRGRILRADTGAPPPSSVDAAVRRRFSRAVKVTPACVKYSF